MATYLTKIKFTVLNGEPCNATYGYQETPGPNSKTLLHLYNEDGEQLDRGNGSFPNAKFEALPYSAHVEDEDGFWDVIESLRDSI